MSLMDYLMPVLMVLLGLLLIRGESIAWSRYNKLMLVIGGIKYRLFDLEARVLQADGVLVPQDMAERYAKFIESQLSDKDLEAIKKRYVAESPPHIPFWKFLVANYRLKVAPEDYGLSASLASEWNALTQELNHQVHALRQAVSALGGPEAAATSMDAMSDVTTRLGTALSTLESRLSAQDNGSTKVETETADRHESASKADVSDSQGTE